MGKNKTTLSNSALDKYNLCPLLYKYHYIDRIRSNRTSSALLFGDAIDEALNCLLLDKDLGKAISIFNQKMNKWKYQFNVDFFKRDLDPDKLGDEDWEEVDSYTDDDERTHMLAWYSLSKKGTEFIDAYYEQVLPKIKKVHSVQKKLTLSNKDGDEIIMYLDAELEFLDNEGVVTLTDHKTSSKSYSKKMIEESQQLHLYSFANKNKEIAYIVLRKDYNTKGELRPIQILTHQASEELQHEILFKFDEVLGKIKNKEFPMTENKNNCKFQFGKPCIYYDICHNNKEIDECDHLTKKEDR